VEHRDSSKQKDTSGARVASATQTNCVTHSAMLSFELAPQWTWSSSGRLSTTAYSKAPTHTATHAETRARLEFEGAQGVWRNGDNDMAGESEEVPTLEQLIGPSSEWMGAFKVDRHSGTNLSNILSSLGASPAQLLSAEDGQLVKWLMQMRNVNHVTEQDKASMSIQIVADCMELHSGLLHTEDGGLELLLKYRLHHELPPALDTPSGLYLCIRACVYTCLVLNM